MVDTGQGLIGTNMFAYCENNPVNYGDPTGNAWVPFHKNTFSNQPPPLPIPRVSPASPKKPSKTPAELLAAALAALGAIGSGSGQTYELGKGWTARIDSGNTRKGTQRHIVVEKGSQVYKQNKDGSPHDGNKGDPPNTIKKVIKEKMKWDWDKKAKSWENHQKYQSMFYDPACEEGECTCTYSTSWDYARDFYMLPMPTPGGKIPAPAPNPAPSFNWQFSLGF